MTFEQTELPGVILVKPDVFLDERGHFLESYNKEKFAQYIPCEFVQDNESSSTYGVFRGFHAQWRPHSQAKLVHVTRGCVLDFAIDIRPNSETFGKYVAKELSAENHHMLFIPENFLHGFLVLSKEGATFTYKVNRFYNKPSEICVLYNDPEINAILPLPKKDIILSAKDSKGISLDDVRQRYLMEENQK